MSAVPYVSLKYANVNDFCDELGITDGQWQALSEEQRNRYSRWVLEGQNKVEAKIIDINPTTSIAKNSDAFTFAFNAVINWALYRKRSKDGSKTKDDAKDDFKSDIEDLRRTLTKDRGTRVKMVAILGKSFKQPNILLPSQLDTEFYGESNITES